MKRKIGFATLQFAIFAASVTATANVSRLVETNPDYAAAWWKVVLAIMLAVWWGSWAWRLARKAGRETRELQIEHGSACAKETARGFAHQASDQAHRLRRIRVLVESNIARGGDPYRGDPARLTRALELILKEAHPPSKVLKVVNCRGCPHHDLCPNPRDPQWACAVLGNPCNRCGSGKPTRECIEQCPTLTPDQVRARLYQDEHGHTIDRLVEEVCSHCEYHEDRYGCERRTADDECSNFQRDHLETESETGVPLCSRCNAEATLTAFDIPNHPKNVTRD
jgi:hypothetical protein